MRMYSPHCTKIQTSLVICLNNSFANHQYSVVGIFIPIFREKGACAEEDCGHCKYFKTCWDGEMSYRLALDKAIEIIKDGGRNEVD